jgi:hypothetical protein
MFLLGLVKMFRLFPLGLTFYCLERTSHFLVHLVVNYKNVKIEIVMAHAILV